MRAEDVRAVLAAAEQVEPAAALALRLAAITGARRSELAALRWEDLDGDCITIDSSRAITRHGNLEERRQPTLIDAPTGTGNRRTVTLDAVTLDALAAARREWGEYGPWVLAAGPRPVNPERVTRWWTRASLRFRRHHRMPARLDRAPARPTPVILHEAGVVADQPVEVLPRRRLQRRAAHHGRRPDRANALVSRT